MTNPVPRSADPVLRIPMRKGVDDHILENWMLICEGAFRSGFFAGWAASYIASEQISPSAMPQDIIEVLKTNASSLEFFFRREPIVGRELARIPADDDPSRYETIALYLLGHGNVGDFDV